MDFILCIITGIIIGLIIPVKKELRRNNDARRRPEYSSKNNSKK